MPTYLSAYEDHLNEIIATGGDEANIELAIEEYNKATPAKLAEWVEAAKLVCAYCKNPALVSGVRASDEVTCAEHKT